MIEAADILVCVGGASTTSSLKPISLMRPGLF